MRARRRRAGAVLTLLGMTLALAAPTVATANPGGGVSVVGEPLVHSFSGSVPDETTETAEWLVSNDASTAVRWDAVLVAVGPLEAHLGEALRVEYAEVPSDGEALRWHEAGSLAAPKSYSEALATSSVTTSAGESELVRARVVLPDVSVLPGEPGAQHDVSAEFQVSYLHDGTTGDGSAAAGGTGHGSTIDGALATTGVDGLAIVLGLGAVSLALGAVAVGRRIHQEQE